jgi:hypothetical protein
MAARQCYHCKQWIEQGESHDCWTTTEEALTRDLPEDLRDAWERLRETAAGFGPQRIYASHHSIMFSRRSCYFFVRPKKNFLEVCLFLRRAVQGPQVRRSDRSSRQKVYNILQIRHRDEVEPPITGWLREAYELADPNRKETAPAKPAGRPRAPRKARKAARRRAK